jgi:2-keto-4-pentenoate hydratase/2-oxohepta-3-ene-1,7-dioic acid hydratase in catechol pathway
MKLVTFEAAGRQRYGALIDDGVVDLPAAQRLLMAQGSLSGQPLLPATLYDVLQWETTGADLARRVLDEVRTELTHGRIVDPSDAAHVFNHDEINWRTPIPHHNRMLSMRGNNPILLRLEGLAIPEHPTLTPRYHGHVIGHQEPIVLRAHAGEIGWGAEFTAVIGRRGKDIKETDAGDHILGYTVINDMSGSVFRTMVPDLPPKAYTYRDEHFAGKFYGTWSMPQPVGPCIVTADEIDDPYHLVVHSRESGLPCDTVTTAAMLFRFERIIAFTSRFMTLKPGDMITSGALGWHTIPGRDRYPPGSFFEVEIEGIGCLHNPIVDQRKGSAP